VAVNFGDNDSIFCNRCKKEDVQIKWNLRVKIMDLHNELPASIQNDATERFLNLNPRDGYLLYIKKRDQFE